MAENIRISVVIAARNMEKHISETLVSVLRQQMEGVEVILVDDGSVDGTAAIAASLREPRLRFVAGPGRGVSAARNAGLDQARAPLVLFLDGDDILMPGALAAMAAALDAQPEAPAAFAGHVKMTEAGEIMPGPVSFYPAAGHDTLRHLMHRNVFVNGGTVCIRTGAARAVGGFTERLSFGEDWEFWCRLALLGDFVALPGVVALGYRQRPDGANHRKAGTATRPNFSPVNAIFSNVMISSHFTAEEVRRARRVAEANVFWAAARNALANGGVWNFFGYLMVGAVRHRAGMMNPKLALRYAASIMRLAIVPGASGEAVRK
jgi:glycosyltransferase involved in cell wall biosynthesis